MSTPMEKKRCLRQLSAGHQRMLSLLLTAAMRRGQPWGDQGEVRIMIGHLPLSH